MSQSQGHTDSDLAREVQRLSEQVASLTGRVDDQDSRVTILEAKAGVVRPARPASNSAPDGTAAPISSSNAGSPAAVTAVTDLANAHPVDGPVDNADASGDAGAGKESSPVDPAANKEAPKPAVPQESLGDWLTRNAPVILSRVGIAAVVIGLCFAVGYSWQYFGPLFKICAGFAGAVGLIAGGEVFSRRKGWGWYGQAITGGGYALAYFVMYAAQNIASVKILDDPLIAMWGLLGIAGGAMAHSVLRRSEAMALLSTLLAFGTISLSPVSGFTVLATAILMVGLSAAVLRQRWLTVYGVACGGSYLTYLLFTQPQVAIIGGANGFWLSAGFLAVFWVVWNVVGFRLYALLRRGAIGDDILSLLPGQAQNFRPQVLFGVSLINGIAFIASSMMAIADAYPQYFYLLLFGLSGAYAVTALAARAAAWRENAQVSSFVALALASGALALKLDPTATLVVWFIEIPLLVFVGLRNKFASFRAFAAVLTVVSLARFAFGGGLFDGHAVLDYFVTIPYNVLVGGFAAAALSVAAFLFRRARRVADCGLSESDGASTAYAAAALALVWGLTVIQAPFYVTAAILAVEALALALLAQRLGLATLSGASKFFLGSALVGSVVTCADIGVIQIAIVLGVNFTMAALYRTGRFHDFISAGRSIGYYLGLTTAGALTGLLLTYLKVDGQVLPVVAACETLLLLGAGIALRDPVLRLLSCLAAALTGIALVSTFGAWTWGVIVPTVIVLYGVYALYRYITPARSQEIDSFLAELNAPLPVLNLELAGLFSLGATALLTIAFTSMLSWQHLAVALALEGFGLVAAAFVVRDRQFFLSALAVFALLIGKLVFYDLRDAEPLWRIISFVVAGCVMLAAAYLGARFNKVFAGPEDGTTSGVGTEPALRDNSVE